MSYSDFYSEEYHSLGNYIEDFYDERNDEFFSIISMSQEADTTGNNNEYNQNIDIYNEEKKENENKEEISKTKSTNSQTKSPLFEISQEKELRGRKRLRSPKRKTHGKDFKDNILDKIKSNLYHNSLELINKQLEEKYGEKYGQLKILDSKEIVTKNKQEKVCFLNLTLRELFSKNVSLIYKKQKDFPLYNKNMINSIYDNNEFELIEIFNQKVKQMAKKYCENKEDIKDDIFKDFKRIGDDIEQFKEEKKEQEYIDKYRNMAENFENIINGITEKNDDKKNSKQ